MMMMMKTVRFLPRFFAEISEFIFRHIVTYVVIVNVVYVFQVLFKQNNEICILSNRLSGKYEILLTNRNSLHYCVFLECNLSRIYFVFF